MNLCKLLIGFFILLSSFGYAQIDINRCSQEIKEDFSPSIFKFLKKGLLSNSSSQSTIFVRYKENLKIFSPSKNGVITAVTDDTEERIAVSYYDKDIFIYDLNTKDTIAKIKSDFKANALLLQNNTLYFGLDNGYVQQYDLNTHKRETIQQHKGIVRALKLIDGNKLLSIGQDGTLAVNHAKKEITQKTFKNKLTSIAITPNQETIAVGTVDGTIYLLNKQYQIKEVFHPHSSIITGLKFTDNTNLYSSSFDKKLIRSEITTKNITVMHTSKDYIMSFDVNNERLIYGDRSGNVRFFNLKCY